METPSSSIVPTQSVDEQNEDAANAEKDEVISAQPQSNGMSHPTDELDSEPNVDANEQSKINEMAEEHSQPTRPDDVYCDEEEDNEDDEPKEPESIYSDTIPNRVIVARNHPLSYYADRARRILRMENELSVLGRGNTISMACTLVEVLKRQKICVVDKLSTGMYVEPFFNTVGDPQWSQPMSMITFRLSRGEYAEFLIGYHQRKVVEIFESRDRQHTGMMSVETVEALKIAENFLASSEMAAEAKAFLAKAAKEASGNIDLPTFIKYASICIHPLLRDNIFKTTLTEKYGIVNTDGSHMASPQNSP